MGLIISISTYSLGSSIESFYGINELSKIVPYLAISSLFYSACTYPTATLLKDQKYYRISLSTSAAEIASTTITISIYKLNILSPIDALASKMLSSSIINFTALQLQSGQTRFGRAKLGKHIKAIKSIASFSGYQLGFNFINYFSRNLDNILVGKLLGASELGLYDKAYQLMRYPLQLITFAITPAIQPFLKENSKDPHLAKGIFQDLSTKLLILGCAAGFFILTFSNQIVYILLGDQWSGASSLIRILALSIPAQMVTAASGSFFQALSKPDHLFLSGSLSALITVSAIAVGISSRNLETLCWCISIAFNLNFYQVIWILYKRCLLTSPSGIMIKFSLSLPLLLLVFNLT